MRPLVSGKQCLPLAIRTPTPQEHRAQVQRAHYREGGVGCRVEKVRTGACLAARPQVTAWREGGFKQALRLDGF